MALASAALVALAQPGSEGGPRAGGASLERVNEPSYESPYVALFERRPSATQLSRLGRVLFFEPGLSASGRQSCATCHDPAHGYGPPDGQDVRLGGADLNLAGQRAVPSLRYRQTTPPFSEHFYDDDDNDSEDQGPAGGYAWDGRARSAQEQAAMPLLSPLEMANESPRAAVQRLAASPSAALFQNTFGPQVFEQPELAWLGLRWALEVFQQSPQDFYPYSSKYDAYLRGQAKLSAAERRGLALFNDDARTGCAVCHISDQRRGAMPQFTDHGLIALGAPRNRRLPANADPSWYDMGLCGPMREDFKDRADYCGRFKTPSLRNVALRRVFFHNGVFHSLREVLDFYAQRDQRPERFYPRDAKGRVQLYNDLPADRQQAVYQEAPFGHRRGEAPSFNAAQTRDLMAFLKTLTDADLLPATRPKPPIKTQAKPKPPSPIPAAR